MKRFLHMALILAGLAWHLPVQAQVTETTLCTANATTSSAAVSCTPSAGTYGGSGHTFAVGGMRAVADASVTMSDGTNTYVTTPGSPCFETTGNRRGWIVYAKNASAVTNPTFTFTFSGAASVSRRTLAVTELAGVSTTAPLDKETCGSSQVSSVPDPGSVALTYSNEIMFEQSKANTTTTLGTGYTTINAGTGDFSQYKIVSNGTWGASAFAVSSTSWMAQAATFTDAVSGTTAPSPPAGLMLGF